MSLVPRDELAQMRGTVPLTDLREEARRWVGKIVRDDVTPEIRRLCEAVLTSFFEERGADGFVESEVVFLLQWVDSTLRAYTLLFAIADGRARVNLQENVVAVAPKGPSPVSEERRN